MIPGMEEAVAPVDRRYEHPPFRTAALDPNRPTWTLILKLREPKPEAVVAKLRHRGWRPPVQVEYVVRGRDSEGNPVSVRCLFVRNLAVDYSRKAVYYAEQDRPVHAPRNLRFAQE